MGIAPIAFSQPVADYTLHGILPRLGEAKVNELLRIADPYQYRHRVTVPKLILNAAGDEFCLPDSSQFYWDELRGENYVRYVPTPPQHVWHGCPRHGCRLPLAGRQ